jgi:hypothetical protein
MLICYCWKEIGWAKLQDEQEQLMGRRNKSTILMDAEFASRKKTLETQFNITHCRFGFSYVQH